MTDQQPVVQWQHVEPETPPPPGSAYRSGRTFAQAAALLIGATTLDYALDGLLSLYGIGLLSDLEHVTDAQLIAYDGIVGIVALLGFGLFIGAAIALVAWLRRTVANVPALGGGTPIVTPNWAVIWWFIPFANLVKPPQIVADVRRRLAPEGSKSTSRIVIGWWLAYVLGSIVANIYGRLPAATTVADFNGQQQINIASDVLLVIAGALIIKIVLDTERWSRARVAAMAAAPAPAATPEAVPAASPEAAHPQAAMPDPAPPSEA